MTATDIDKKLRDKFKSHKYELSNSYVYNWESDFFSISSTGYAQEIEVKVSLSDFRADFRKEDKHKLLNSKIKGEKYILSRGEEVYNLKYETKKYLLNNGRRIWDEEKGGYKSIGTGDIREKVVRASMISYYENQFLNCSYKQISTEINIQELSRCPNKFWYCCPEGVIPLSEVPEYAGLYYISPNMRMTVIKKAPFIHKEKQDLRQVLLDKFYWESVNLRNSINRKQLSLSY